MKIQYVILLVIVLYCCRAAASANSVGNHMEVTYLANDGILVHGRLLKNHHHKNAPTAVLFHMAGSNSYGEYFGFHNKIVNQGFNVLAVDTRAGGEKFNHSNKTVTYDSSLEGAEYCEASFDVEASIHYVREKVSSGPIILIGSSFSGALVINATAKYPEDVAGFVAFSPASGSPMSGCEPEESLNADIKGIVIRPKSELEYGWIKEQFARFQQHGLETVAIENGIHGASTLNDERMKRDMSAIRTQILAWMVKLATTREQKLVFNVDDWDIVSYIRAAMGPKIVLIFNQAAGYSAQYMSVSRKMAEANIAALRVDLRGHGESSNLGAFDPHVKGAELMLFQSHREIIEILQYVIKGLGYTPDDIQVISASYSTDEVLKAQKMLKLDLNHFAFSPGSLSLESIKYMSQSSKKIIVYRSANEQKFFAELFTKIAIQAPNVTRVTIKGSGHGTGILKKNPMLVNELISSIN